MGSRILAGRYELIEKIGEGGMAVVFKARDRLLNRYVAIKILRPEYTKDEGFIDSFRRESQIAANLVHPNIVNVYDVGKEGNIYYIVMELVDGKALSEIIKSEAPLEPRRAATIAKQIASALALAHKHQLIHRDVKPHNILITSDGVAKISDFGIAKAVTQDTFVEGGTEAVMGSVHYFSPEQARGAYVDEKSDIYSLGIVLYEMLTGKVPFDGDTAVSVAVKHMNEPLVPPTQLNPEIPSDLEEIVLKACSKLQMNRYKSADDMITALNFVKFSRYADPNAAAAAAAEHGHKKDTLTEISDENYKKEVEAAAAEGRELDTEAEIQKRREKREEKEKRGKKKKGVSDAPSRQRSDGDDDDDDDDYEDVFHPGRHIFFILLIIALFAGADFGINLLQGFKGDIKGTTHELPDLVGMMYEQAAEELEKLNINLEIEVQAVSNKPTGTILSQNPMKDAVVKEGQVVRVSISKGQDIVTVPDLSGISESKAKAILESLHYILGEVGHEFSDTVAKGLIISQDVEPKTELEPYSIINVVISDGPEDAEEVGVNLVGMTLADAQYLLKDLGYEIGEVQNVISSSVEWGVIINTEPAPNTELEEGQTIKILVSMGDGTQGHVQPIDPDAPIEGETTEAPQDPAAGETGGEAPVATDPGAAATAPGTATDPGTTDPGAATPGDTPSGGEQPVATVPVYSVGITIDFSNAVTDTFEFVVHVNDGINAASSTSLGTRQKGGSEMITVSGSGSNGKVVVMYGNSMAYSFDVDFENQSYVMTFHGNNY